MVQNKPKMAQNRPKIALKIGKTLKFEDKDTHIHPTSHNHILPERGDCPLQDSSSAYNVKLCHQKMLNPAFDVLKKSRHYMLF